MGAAGAEARCDMHSTVVTVQTGFGLGHPGLDSRSVSDNSSGTSTGSVGKLTWQTWSLVCTGPSIVLVLRRCLFEYDKPSCWFSS